MEPPEWWSGLGAASLEGGEDRSQWKYEDGGRPLDVAVQFVDWLHDSRRDMAAGEALVVRENWPSWKREVLAPSEVSARLSQLNGALQRIRYPADGMAYVFYLVGSSDQRGSVVIPEAMMLAGSAVTLLFEDGDWKVYQIGEMVPPSDVGLRAYSW